MAFGCGPKDMTIISRSHLELRFSDFRDDNEVVWDVGRLMLAENNETGVFFTVNRDLRSPNELGDVYQRGWEAIAEQRHPYNRSAFREDKFTMIGAVHAHPKRSASIDVAPLLYTVVFGINGNVVQDDMEARLRGFEEKLVIKEY